MKTEQELKDYVINSLKATPALVESKSLQVEFTDFIETLEEIDQVSTAIVVNSDETLAVAENGYSFLMDVLKNLDNKRVVYKAPYYNTVKLIDGYAKRIKDVLEVAKGRYNKKISQYKSIQRAAAEAEAKKELERVQKLNEKKVAEKDRIVRIEKMILSKAFGGIWLKKTGEAVQEAGCKTKDDCTKLLQLLDKNFPGPDEFEYFSELSIATKERVTGNIVDLMTNLIIENPEVAESIREKASKEAELNDAVMDKVISSQTREVVKEAEMGIKEAGKGLRSTLKYTVENEEELDRRFLSVDSAKIRDFMNENKDKIKEILAKGGQPNVKGIRFYVETKHISS